MKPINDETKAKLLGNLYSLATRRKVYIGIMTLIAMLATFFMLYLFREKLEALFIFLGAGASIVVFGVVLIFSNINDTYYDIASSMYPEQFPDD